jgi:hypothetical protein
VRVAIDSVPTTIHIKENICAKEDLGKKPLTTRKNIDLKISACSLSEGIPNTLYPLHAGDSIYLDIDNIGFNSGE